MRNRAVFPFPRAPLEARLELVRQTENLLKRLPLPKEEEREQMALLFDLLVREERRILRKLWRLR